MRPAAPFHPHGINSSAHDHRAPRILPGATTNGAPFIALVAQGPLNSYARAVYPTHTVHPTQTMRDTSYPPYNSAIAAPVFGNFWNVTAQSRHPVEDLRLHMPQQQRPALMARNASQSVFLRFVHTQLFSSSARASRSLGQHIFRAIGDGSLALFTLTEAEMSRMSLPMLLRYYVLPTHEFLRRIHVKLYGSQTFRRNQRLHPLMLLDKDHIESLGQQQLIELIYSTLS